ncbi:hypothetical protein GCM10011571_20530 [Marinithermofilum abyssi]|uniref:DUF4145 domain-containing protein n=2 Tax=Marinithermofilum abyssi TaxID=1571185 RepID=A0A8J2YCS6_9BACL|nr:hypothetical protein GCM10011571_20530 [Marinithermofilum abyssi]
MARIIYAEEKLEKPEPSDQYERLKSLRYRGELPQEVIGMFHSLRKKGNKAVHDFVGTFEEAAAQLKIAYKLGVWFMQTYGDWEFEPVGYQEPEPVPQPDEIRRELEKKFQREQEKLERKWEDELERIREEYRTQHYILERRRQARSAANSLDLTEEETRRIIDSQLKQAGWEADSRHLRFASGARPEKGKNLAIAEWPTAHGSADYALFAGLKLVGLVEAKKMSKDIPSDLEHEEVCPFYRAQILGGDHRPLGGLPGTLRVCHQWPGLFQTDRREVRYLVPGPAPSEQSGACLARLVFSGRPAGEVGAGRRTSAIPVGR